MKSHRFTSLIYRLPVFLLSALLILGASSHLGTNKPLTQVSNAQGQARLVLAFYYAWYTPDSFGPNLTPYQPFSPYFSTDATVIQRHIEEAKAAGIDAFVQSWYGPTGNQTENNFQTLLSIASTKGFRAAIDFETGGPLFSSNDDRISALTVLLATHAQHPAYLRVDGKPVIFFWANWLISVEDWRLIREAVDPESRSIWIAEGGHANYLAVFDGLHLYNIAWSDSPGGVLSTWAARTRSAASQFGAHKYWIATAMPGFDDSLLGRGEESIVRNRSNGTYFQTSFAGAAATSPDMIIITSFNEWREGSNIEPSVEFGNLYLDLSAQLSSSYKSGSVPPAPITQPSVQATSEPSVGSLDDSPTPELVVTNSPTPFVTPTPNSDGTIFYTVQPGDTLILIADRFRVPLEQLLRLNQISEEALLSIGQKLIIMVADTFQEPEAVTVFPEATTEADGTIRYEVKENDTLIEIALQYDLTLAEILELNPDLTSDSLLRIGQPLIVGIDSRPADIGGSTAGVSPISTADEPQLLPTSTPTFVSSFLTTVPETASATPSKTVIATVESTVTRQAPQLDEGGGIFAAPQIFIVLIAVLAILGSGFLYLGRRT